MLKVRLPAIILVLCLIFSFAASADVSENNVKAVVASEYISDNMYEDFEETGEKTEAVAAIGENLKLSCSSAILMEKATKTILYEYNPDEKRAPASITKVMTLLLVMEAVEDGKLHLNDVVTASEHASSMGGSQIWLEPGETMSVTELLKAVAVASANDASVALGEHIAGSEESFVAMMNARAKELGMLSTNFVNCCGLDADGHVTTARDIAIMSCELLKHDIIKEYSQIWIDYLRNNETQLVNTNKLVRFFNGTTGLKTGTTDKAGFCVSASAERDSMELVAVVLNGQTSDLRFSDAKALLNYGFANWSIAEVDMSQMIFDPVRVIHGTEQRVEVVCEDLTPFLVPKGKQSGITFGVTLPENVLAPVEEGQLIGKVTYLLDNEQIGESKLVAEKSVQKLTFSRALFRLLSSIVKL